jgi:hypothetical protein
LEQGALILAGGVVTAFLGFDTAYAYVDPGAGGLTYQIIVIALAIIVSYVVLIKGNVTKIFKKGARTESANKEKEEEGDH